MIVVSDASPLNYLILIGQINVLAELFSEVLIPPSVRDELRHTSAPDSVLRWIAKPPRWLRIESPSQLLTLQLDKGEVDAISLAVEMGISTLLIDERKGRRRAQELGLAAIGTIALLEFAARQGKLNLRDCFVKLQQTNFRASPELLSEALRRTGDDPM